MSKEIKNRYEFVLLFDVENGNPNGDPDAGNMPRIDVETGHGLVTDGCLKRKIRNYVELIKKDQDKYKIYVKLDMPLNDKHESAYSSLHFKSSKEEKSKEHKETAKTFMCENFFDVRTFGAVMSTGDHNCGQVRGPVQINFARSIDSVVQSEISITRQAVTTKKDFDNKDNEMGRKHIIPYGLYKAEGYISANLAQQTGFNEDDLELLWESIVNMFEHDHSAARGKMAVRKLITFKHDSELGNTQAHKLFETIKINLKDTSKPPRAFSDYEVKIDNTLIPKEVQLIEKI